MNDKAQKSTEVACNSGAVEQKSTEVQEQQQSNARWWRKRADEIELAVACGKMDASACYTQMRQLIQAATAPEHEQKPTPATAQKGTP